MSASAARGTAALRRGAKPANEAPRRKGKGAPRRVKTV